MQEPAPCRVKAPARVNLIGEHTDYTGGLVLPLAIPFYTEAVLEVAGDGLYRFESDLFPQTRTLTPGDPLAREGTWADYPVGVLAELEKLGYRPAPFRIRFGSDIPLGSGLSSSASLEVATALALLRHMGRDMAPEALALLCQRAENLFVGAPSGIMDQAAVTLAQKDHALLLDTRTLTTAAVPMNRGTLAETVLVVCNSGVKHSIAAGEYGERRRQAEQGQKAIRRYKPQAADLGQATMEDLEAVRARLTPEAVRRTRHILTENDRVRSMRAAMDAGDAETAGRLMKASHVSQRDDFECSVPEIDFLVEAALKLPGCYGSRLTGGGFGGCTVSLVQANEVGRFTDGLTRRFRERWALEASTFVCEPVDGAARLQAAAWETA